MTQTDVDALLKDPRTACDLLLSAKVEERFFVLWQLFNMLGTHVRMAQLTLRGLADTYPEERFTQDVVAALGVTDHVVRAADEFSAILWLRLQELGGVTPSDDVAPERLN